MTSTNFEDEIPELVEPEPGPSESAPASVHVTTAEDHSGGLAVEACPITILTGFLGSGKTTLLDYILTKQNDRKIAVIMNEFGDSAGIESKALSVSDPDRDGDLYEEMLELNNGCICCTVKDNGVKAIETLMERRRASAKDPKAKGKAFDYILLETTGLADPVPIAQMFWQDEALASEIYLDAIVCVVDSVYAMKQLKEVSSERETFIRQIAASDTILLNKTDIADAALFRQTRAELKSINASAPVFNTIKGAIDLSKLLGLNAYGAHQSGPPPKFDGSEEAHGDCTAAGDGHVDHDHPHDLSSIITLSLPLPKLDDKQQDRLDGIVQSLLWEGRVRGSSRQQSSIEVLRTKGLFWNRQQGRAYVIQGVREIYEFRSVRSSEEDTVGQLVLIGKGLSEAVRTDLASLLSEL